jgi:hypothetical protein
LIRADAEAEKKVSSETSPRFAAKLALLSLYLLRDGRAREGANYLERARRIYRGGTPVQEAGIRLLLGESLLLLGRREEAVTLLAEGRAFYAANFPAAFPHRIVVDELLARAQGGLAPKHEKR